MNALLWIKQKFPMEGVSNPRVQQKIPNRSRRDENDIHLVEFHWDYLQRPPLEWPPCLQKMIKIDEQRIVVEHKSSAEHFLGAIFVEGTLFPMQFWKTNSCTLDLPPSPRYQAVPFIPMWIFSLFRRDLIRPLKCPVKHEQKMVCSRIGFEFGLKMYCSMF